MSMGHMRRLHFTYLGQTPHLGGHDDDDAVCAERGSEWMSLTGCFSLLFVFWYREEYLSGEDW